MKTRHISFAIVTGLLSGVITLLYAKVYQEALIVDYSEVITTAAIFISCIVGSILATAGYTALVKVIPKYGEIIFGLLFAMICFASIVGVFAVQLPDSDDESYYFLIYGFAIPMHFFPFITWYVLKPIFIKAK
jgi:hypothetical protein